jgi:hypothetical protein
MLRRDELRHAGARQPRVPGFVTGLAAGTFVGAVLAIWLTPRVRRGLSRAVVQGARKVEHAAQVAGGECPPEATVRAGGPRSSPLPKAL